MDSISQIALGGAVAYLVAGKQAPRLALIAGAVIGTLPDLDVLVQYSDPLQSTIAHRTWSHSWFVHTAVTPLLAYAASLYLPKLSFKRWCALIWLCLVTHSALDCLTIYGTGALWPLPVATVMQASTFIIDPLFTLPLLAALVIAWRRREPRSGRLVVPIALTMSCLYLGWGLLAQSKIEQRLVQQLASQQIKPSAYIATPTPFNSLLWRVMAIDGAHYYEGYASVFDQSADIKLVQHQRDISQLDALQEFASFRGYEKFTHQFYTINNVDSTIILKDLRMGLTPHFVFQFALAQQVSDRLIAIPPRSTAHGHLSIGPIREVFGFLRKRLFDPVAQFPLDLDGTIKVGQIKVGQIKVGQIKVGQIKSESGIVAHHEETKRL